MPRRVVVLLAVVLAVAGCGAGNDDQSARIAELEAEVAELRARAQAAEAAAEAAEAAADAATEEASDDAAAADDEPSPPAATPSAIPSPSPSTPPPPSPATDDLSEARGFETPSGNIACLAADYGSGPYLQCEIGSQLNPPPDDVCDFDWSGITMRATGAATPLCASDTMRGELGTDPEVLAYGESWIAGPFTCLSEDTGLTCTNGDGGRLFLSRASWDAG